MHKVVIFDTLQIALLGQVPEKYTAVNPSVYAKAKINS